MGFITNITQTTTATYRSAASFASKCLHCLPVQKYYSQGSNIRLPSGLSEGHTMEVVGESTGVHLEGGTTFIQILPVTCFPELENKVQRTDTENELHGT